MSDQQLSTGQALEQETISLIWFVPLIALIIAISLAINAWKSQGPTVEIYFKKAEGIEPKQTKIRYKNVDVGIVESVKVSDTLASIVVTAELAPEFSEYLSENTTFWVVSPKVSLSGISGLNTLVSGVYIEIDPGEPGEEQFLFQGLDDPPLVRSDSKGTSHTLFTQELGSIDIGSPVYFKQIKVGEVTSYQLLTDNQDIEVTIFVEAPYDKLVTGYSRFWNVSGFDIGLGSNGVSVELESINALISGGIAFDSPYIEDAEKPAALSNYYILPNRQAVLDGAYVTSYSFILHFINQSVRGLQPGSPVEYYGVKIGQVREINFSDIQTNDESNLVAIDVLIDIQPERMSQELESELFEEHINSMVNNGLRGQLDSGSIITGGLYVKLVDTNKKQNKKLDYQRGYAVIPTIPGDINQATQQLASIVNKINQVPIVKMGEDLASSLNQLNNLLSELNQSNFSSKINNTIANVDSAAQDFKKITASALGSLEQLQKTLSTMEESIAPDSQLYFEFLETLKGINESADSLRQFTDELNRYPQSLILGK